MTASPINPDETRRAAKNPGDEMLTLQEACRFLRVAEGTLRCWRHLGCGPRSFNIGRHVRYWRANLTPWLRADHSSTGSQLSDAALPPPPGRRTHDGRVSEG